MDPLIAKERQNATFPVNEMSKVLWGGEQGLKRVLWLQKLVVEDPVFNNEDRPFLSRTERFKKGLQKGIRLIQIAATNSITNASEIADILAFFADEQLPSFLHYGMFIPTIRGQGTIEQAREWLGQAYPFQIIGCYAQTELGHGSFIRGLETTATYDSKTQEFIIHSPTLTSTKWWPGGLGIASTHAVVVARLITQGKEFGPHNFVVQIRSLEDHKPLPGVTVGDIGPKFGYSAMDNGFLRFNQFRVPRDALLMKYSQVTPEGEYIKPPHNKVSYGTMVLIRASIVAGASQVLGRALTVAVRYSAVRRQFPKPDSTPSSKFASGWDEQPILNYQTQQQKLLPLLAIAYAFHFTKNQMLQMFNNMEKDLAKGSYESLAEVHAASAGLKAITTDTTSQGIEVCRKACGGHGYSLFSGIPDMYTDYVPACTYEGDNTVMLLQTARYLLKAFNAGQSGSSVHGNLSFFQKEKLAQVLNERCSAQKPEDLLDFEVQLQIFRHRVARLAHEVVTQIQNYQSTHFGGEAQTAEENAKVDLIRMTVAYCWQLVQMNFVNALRNADSDELRGAPESVRQSLKQLSDLFTISHIEENLGDFTEDGFLSPQQSRWVRSLSRQLLATVRRDAVQLVDAFQYDDRFLCSALGRYDGNYMEAMYKWAQKEPLNNVYPPVGYEQFLKPILNGSANRSKL